MAPRKRRAPRRAASSTADSPMGEEIGEDEIMDESGDFQPSASIDGGEDLNNIGDDEEEDEGGEEEEQESMEQTLVEFLEKMESHPPIIPDAVTDFYLMKAGVDCPDVRLKRMMALASQKFITDIVQDAFQYSRLRQQSMPAKDKKQQQRETKKTVLTMEDLSPALAEYGINLKRPDYFT